MKPGIAFCMILIISWNFCSGQETENPDPANVPLPNQYQELPDSLNIIGSEIIKKGNITLLNDENIKFSNLALINDSVSFLQKNKGKTILPLTAIKGITKTKSHPGIGALTGGVAGMFGGLLVSGLVNPRRTTEEWINDQIDGEEDTQEIRSEDVPYMAIGAAAGAAIGALVGLKIKNSTVVYFKNKPVEVFPVLGFCQGYEPAFMVTLKFTID